MTGAAAVLGRLAPLPLVTDPGTELVLAAVLGTLFALGTFLVLRRDLVRVVWGVTIIAQSANLYLVTMGGIRGTVPIVGHGPPENAATVTDPLVQAHVLTAIVIGFGTTAFALVLTYRVYEEHGTIDLADLGRHAESEVGRSSGIDAAAADDRVEAGGGDAR